MSNAAIVAIGVYNQYLASEGCMRMEGFQRVDQQCTISDMEEEKEEEEVGVHKYPYKARDENSVGENFNNLLKPLLSMP